MSRDGRPSFCVIIVGAGIAGLAASIGLRRKGHHVIVLEQTSELQTIGGRLLIPPCASRVLDSYGLWEKFRDADYIPPTHTTYRYADGKVLESMSHAAVGSRFGYPIFSLSRAMYQQMLFSAAINEGVEVRLTSHIAHVDESIPAVTLVSGEKLKGDILVGADGIKSSVREAVLGENDVQPIPESIAYQCTIPADVMRSNPLTSPLMDGNLIHSWYGPRRSIICGVGEHGSSYNCTLAVFPGNDGENKDTLDVLVPNSSSSSRQGDINEMRKSVETSDPRVRAFIGMVKPDDCFLWKIGYLPKLNTWVSASGKVTVVGDAAHAMVPHLGMGAAAAVEDGAVLAECLSRASTVDDIPTALHAYERIRKPRSERIQAAALATGIVKALPDGPEQRERDRKMTARMDPKNPKYELWKAAGALDWLYAYNFVDSAKEELDTAFGSAMKGGKQSRL